MLCSILFSKGVFSRGSWLKFSPLLFSSIFLFSSIKFCSVFSSVIKKEINQQSLHYEKSDNILITEILSGPAKGSVIDIHFSIDQSGTKIDVKISLKLSLKYKILQPIIVKWYKLILQGILLKMNAKIISSDTKLRS